MKNRSFVEYVVHDLLAAYSGITSKAMFGGYALYKDNAVFALIIDEQLYLKADADSAGYFKQHGSQPFTYTNKNGKTVSMAYYIVPDEVLESRSPLREWLARTFAVALQAQTNKKKR